MKKYLLSLFLMVGLLLSCGGGSKHYIEDNTPPPQLVANSANTKEDNELKKKYADLLEVSPEKITDIKLYKFIDEWMGAPYLMGGETKSGIDCSSFAQHLYNEVYDCLLERTAHKQRLAKSTEKFIGQKHLKEGDLLFFKAYKSRDRTITHVGIYLQNNKFISATSYRGPTKSSGVKISDFKLPYWQEKFVAAGRKMLDKYK